MVTKELSQYIPFAYKTFQNTYVNFLVITYHFIKDKHM